MIQTLALDFPVRVLCDLLGVSKTAYYRFCSGKSYQISGQKADKLQAVEDVFWEHKRRYGSRRITAELQAEGYHIGRHQVRTFMKANTLHAIQPKRFVPKTTDSRHGKAICRNLLLGQSLPVAPNQVWVGDITYLPLATGGWGYLATWLDLFSRMIVGWQVDLHMEADLVTGALRNALQWRRPNANLIIHSDRGGQYVAESLKELLDLYECRQSMSRKANCYDNAFAESFYSRFKTELLEGGAFLTVEDARTEVFEFIEMYYNRKRRHSSIGNQSPLDFETEFYLSLT